MVLVRNCAQMTNFWQQGRNYENRDKKKTSYQNKVIVLVELLHPQNIMTLLSYYYDFILVILLFLYIIYL